ncbi:hypothetical protein PWR66_03215 [Paraburkholderia sp. A1RO-5]|uniref:hypothetical protein n=1 Tax=Paraburkholderia sp. A1RO-5 TaxID=3028369 RepID=UPI003B7DC3B8
MIQYYVNVDRLFEWSAIFGDFRGQYAHSGVVARVRRRRGAGNQMDSAQGFAFDIPAHSDLDLALPVDGDALRQGRTLGVSLVHEGVFWAYDIGIKLLRIDLG